MKKYLDFIFNKNVNCDIELLSSSLFVSFDDLSALRKDYKKVIDKVKITDKYNLIKSNTRQLNEGYEQGHFIINIDEKYYFLRLILVDKKIYDILIYTINDMSFVNRVFFSKKELNIPKEFEEKLNINKPVICLYKDNKDYIIVKGNSIFYEMIGYEDWDYKNKYQNILNQICIDYIVDVNKLSLYKSNGDLIYIKTDCLYLNEYILLIGE